MRRPVRSLLAAALLVLGAGAAQAQPAATPAAPANAPAWGFSLTPYVWLPALRGTVQTPLPRVGDRSFELGSGTVFTDLSAVPVMVAGEIRYDRFMLVGDFVYSAVTQDIRVGRDLLFDGGHVRAITTFGTLLGMVRAVETPSQTFDLGAGTRIWNFSNKVSLNPGLAGGAIQKSSLTWADPLLAARYHARLSPAFGLSLYGDVGGFNAGSRITWQVVGSADYDMSQQVTLRAGWRYLNVDKTRGSVGVDLGFNGPFLAATFRF